MEADVRRDVRKNMIATDDRLGPLVGEAHMARRVPRSPDDGEIVWADRDRIAACIPARPIDDVGVSRGWHVRPRGERAGFLSRRAVAHEPLSHLVSELLAV